MFFGIVILVVLGANSYIHAMQLPDGASSSLWVFKVDSSTDSHGACIGEVHAAGLRGAILAWWDGLLSSVNQFYWGVKMQRSIHT